MVDVKYACYGIEAEDGIVVDAPPIAKWMIGKQLWPVLRWIKRRGSYAFVRRSATAEVQRVGLPRSKTSAGKNGAAG